MAVERYLSPVASTAAHSEIDEAGGKLVGYAVLPAGIGTFLLVGGIAAGSAVLLVSGALITILAVGFILYYVQDHRAWHPSELYFDKWPVALGATVQVTVVRASKTSLPERDAVSVPGELICTEEVTYRQGTDTRTDRRQVYGGPIQVTGAVHSNAFVGQVGLKIPVDFGGPSLDLRNNKIYWELEIDLSEFSKTGHNADAIITVEPVLDRSEARYVDAPPPPEPQDFGPDNA